MAPYGIVATVVVMSPQMRVTVNPSWKGLVVLALDALKWRAPEKRQAARLADLLARKPTLRPRNGGTKIHRQIARSTFPAREPGISSTYGNR